ncbi:hypothetical protein [Stackebrandtia nassauensis]|uniref:Uncharacterized protein n=1 Tax=Stackebrandtia nassauensis (strain DSM 44728 / CIP 108903 / NRRL B-16338 / NBRC 102104 / LLR-40K-21) TaxID=446470 RepID=D3Q1B5_STANL|nr:hypothetical protein [Stackebrandtia nassauensis]ADD45695.1 hypothetical protein Snas_6071 [Stackebrandtia nassauensis DSM 44728]
MNTFEKFRANRLRRAEAAHQRAIMRKRVESSTDLARRDAMLYSNRLM